MYLQKLQLENFRNCKNLTLEIEPKPGITILLGNNAEGKTNLLESIFLLSFPRSFRSKSPRELITFNENYYTIEADFKTDEDKDLKLKIGHQLKPVRRSYQRNKIEIGLKEYLTNFQSVIFTPEDIEIINGAPSQRRRLVDTLLSQIDREYFQDMVSFTRILKQRNALLKQLKEHKADHDELRFWDTELIKYTVNIVEKRRKYFDFVAQKMKQIYTDISGDATEKIEVEYSYPAKNRAGHYETYEDALRAYLHDEQNQEIIVGHTLIGPHRDDFQFKLNGKLVSQFCSRGEKRSFMLALKVIEIEYQKQATGQTPVLLLDDVFSELDRERRIKLLELTENYQTFISTVEESYFAGFNKEKINLFSVCEGSLNML